MAAAFGEPSDGGCQGPVFKLNGVTYVRELLKKDIDSPQILSYERSTNSIFLEYYHSATFTKIGARINLDTNKFDIINRGQFVGAVAVDAKTNKVYFEAGEGIYKYDANNNRAELYIDTFYLMRSFSKMLLVKEDVVYISTFPSWTAYKIGDGVKSKLEDLKNTTVKNLFIDDNENMFFTNDTGLYRQKVGSQEVVYYKKSEGLPFYGVTMSNAGDIYAFASDFGIYAVSKNTNEMSRVLDVTARGLTFDGAGNMIYADYKDLYRLKPSYDCI